MELDRLMPRFDVAKQHDQPIAASSETVWEALLDLDLNRSPVVRMLMLARGIPRRSLGWSDFERFGFVPLHRDRPRELVLGVIAQPWRLTGGIRRIDRDAFTGFDDPGFAVICWNYLLRPAAGETHVTTITRIRCTDDESLAKFRRYWTLIGPFSGLIRRESLRLLARGARHGGP